MRVCGCVLEWLGGTVVRIKQEAWPLATHAPHEEDFELRRRYPRGSGNDVRPEWNRADTLHGAPLSDERGELQQREGYEGGAQLVVF